MPIKVPLTRTFRAKKLNTKMKNKEICLIKVRVNNKNNKSWS
jgi:hypothetical protein